MRYKPARLKSNAEWRRWGKEDPLWAVVTEPGRKRGEPSAWTNVEFYAAGESDWRDFFPHWHRYGVNTESCLEIGCGAGRITRLLSLAFDKVYAVDVSEDMIVCARSATQSGNVEFCLTDGLDLPQADCSVKAVFSTHVLQHLDTAQIALDYFREFFRVLDFGGSIMIHVPIYEWPGTGRIAKLLRTIHVIMSKISDGLAWAKRRAHLRMMRGTACHAQFLYHSLAGLGFKDIEFRTFAISRNGALHSFVMARK